MRRRISGRPAGSRMVRPREGRVRGAWHRRGGAAGEIPLLFPFLYQPGETGSAGPLVGGPAQRDHSLGFFPRSWDFEVRLGILGFSSKNRMNLGIFGHVGNFDRCLTSANCRYRPSWQAKQRVDENRRGPASLRPLRSGQRSRKQWARIQSSRADSRDRNL